jgi:bacterioferritin-associated ferredoxin
MVKRVYVICIRRPTTPRQAQARVEEASWCGACMEEDKQMILITLMMLADRLGAARSLNRLQKPLSAGSR